MNTSGNRLLLTATSLVAVLLQIKAKAIVAASLEEGSYNNANPMIINVGQGTTATRTFFHAFCKLNLSSLHWTSYCKENDKNKILEDSERLVLQHKQKRAESAQGRVIGLTRQMQLCVEDPTKRYSPTCSVDATVEMFMDMKQAMSDVIASGGVQVLLDTPYTRMIPFLRNEIENLTGMPPILIMSEREPKHWSERRFDDTEVDVVCKSIFDDEDDSSNNMVDPFDLDRCLSIALQQKNPKYFIDVFTTNRYLRQQEKEKSQNQVALTTPTLLRGAHGEIYTTIDDAETTFQQGWNKILNKLANALEKFQTFYEPQTLYHENLFDVKERMTDTNVAHRIHYAITTSNDHQTHTEILRKRGMNLYGGKQMVYVNVSS